ncbi:ATP-dependent RNA helicase [Candidatus Saccharibacteria bacterium]|nr:ATP-dependent RNA helicase [Candidatus Saccharibacteria bacterium]
MNKPNPASAFKRRQSLRTPESPATPPAAYEQSVVDVPETARDDEAAKARRIDYQLGNPELPIAGYREQIVSAVDCSQAVVITAETGAGKSTQVPQFLAEAGYEVVVTQPRVVAARSVAERVSEEVVAKYGDNFKEFVGYRTARERGDSAANQILFATDGLQLVRELSGHGVGKKQALVLDEVHEWNENMEVLVAWSKQRIAEDPDFKVVTMSATMEADKLSKYFTNGTERQVPIIEVPGRTFEVKKSEGGDVVDQAVKLAREGKNTLVFVPGKAEIDQVMAQMEHANIAGATILPLHGQMEKEDQRKVFKRYPGVKVIVATNVAQTSVTIEDIDAVVDSGLERTNEVRNGVEGLYLKPISQADCLQRAGRAGRTKEGEYVLAQLGHNPFVALKDREPYGTPEILRTRLDGMVLRLAKNGFDAATMDFYHSKDESGRDIKPEIAAAKERLQKLGALREDDSITKIGRDMERMPVESHYARMMIEARKYGPEVQMQLAALLAVQEADGITQFGSRNRPSDERWRSLLQSGINDSDMIKQLEVFIAARSMSDREKRDNDIFVKAVGKANEALRQLRNVERLNDQELVLPTAEQREQLVKCIISGMVDNLYISDAYYGYRDALGRSRELSSRATIRSGNMVVGKPFDLQVNTRRGPMTLNLLESPTNVPSVDTLREVAPQLFSERSRGLMVGPDGVAYEQFEQIFNGHNTGEEIARPAAESPERTNALVRVAVANFWQSAEMQSIIAAAIDLNNRRPGSVNTITIDQLRNVTIQATPTGVASVSEVSEYLPNFSLEDLLPAEKRQVILESSPDEFSGRALIYRDGKPMLGAALSEDEILALNADELVLPDGRQIGLRDSWGAYINVEQYQKRLMSLRAEREEAARAAHASRVSEAVGYFESGYRKDTVVSRFGEEAAEEAWNMYSSEQERIESEKREAEARRSEVLAHISRLIEINTDLYERTRVDGVESAPTEIKDEMLDTQHELDRIKRELSRDRRRLERGHSVAVNTYVEQMERIEARLSVVITRYNKWSEEQISRDTQPVSADALAALAAKFNNR